jgi:xanthine dehydrogenase small subunit
MIMSETLLDTLSERPIQFYFQGKVQQVNKPAATRTVLQFLREDCHATGTKEGCAEGDCGACTVVVGELKNDPQHHHGEQILQLRAINSCVQFLPTLDGKALFTVEDVAQQSATLPASSPPQLHPIQQAMVDQHASQCGFCTPGFVMSLWAMYENHPSCPSTEKITEYLSGNLCRCTGYRPILDAAKAAYLLPRSHLATQSIIKKLVELNQLPSLAYTSNKQHFFAPKTVAELAQLRLQYPQARLLAGSTDIGLWVTKQGRDLGDIIYLGAIEALKNIQQINDDENGYLEIGAMASLTDAFEALTSLHSGWNELARRFASRPIQNAGTLGGNVANGSPIGDSMPALIVLNASVILQRDDVVRELPLDEFYLDYQKTALAQGEFLAAIRVPYPSAALGKHYFNSYKIAKRNEQDISAVCSAFSVYLDSDNMVQAVRVAYGGVAAIPKRAVHCERILLGQLWDSDLIQQAQKSLKQDFSPLSDGRASAEYRQTVAANLLQRFYVETVNNELAGSKVDRSITRLSDLIPTTDISHVEGV